MLSVNMGVVFYAHIFYENYKNFSMLFTGDIKEFIEIVNPKISLIEVGEKNTFGHTSASVLKILQVVKSKIYRTDLCGEITMETNGKWIKLNKVMCINIVRLSVFQKRRIKCIYKKCFYICMWVVYTVIYAILSL